MTDTPFDHEQPIVEGDVYCIELHPHAAASGPDKYFPGGTAPSDFGGPAFDRRVLLGGPDPALVIGGTEIANNVPILDEFHTTRPTTKSDGPAQTDYGRVEITAHVRPYSPLLDGKTVHFRVSDPDDDSSYEVDNVGDDNKDPVVGPGILLHSPGTPDPADIGKQFPNRTNGSDTIGLRLINGVDTAAAEVTLDFTNRYAGDNYFVEAAMDQTGDDQPDWDMAASIILVAWKRMGVEVDEMYANCTDIKEVGRDPLTNKITSVRVERPGHLMAFIPVRLPDGIWILVPMLAPELLVFDNKNKEKRTPSHLEGDWIHFEKALVNEYVPVSSPGLGAAVSATIWAGQTTGGRYLGWVGDAFGKETVGKDGGCFLEWVELPQPEASRIVPYRYFFGNALDDRDFRDFWCHPANRGKKCVVYLCFGERTYLPEREPTGYSWPSDNIVLMGRRRAYDIPFLGMALDGGETYFNGHQTCHELGHQAIGSDSSHDIRSGGYLYPTDTDHFYEPRDGFDAYVWCHLGRPRRNLFEWEFFNETYWCAMAYYGRVLQTMRVSDAYFRYSVEVYNYPEFCTWHIDNIRSQVNDPEGWDSTLSGLSVAIGATVSTAQEHPTTPTNGEFRITGASQPYEFTVAGSATLNLDFELRGTLGGILNQLLSDRVDGDVITVVPLDDSDHEGPEDVTIQLRPRSNYYVAFNTDTATVTIGDDESGPGVTIQAARSASESGETGEFTLVRHGDMSGELIVNISATAPNGTPGIAEEGTDYDSLGSQVTIPAGVSTVPVTVIPLEDSEVEGRESVEVTIGVGAGYTPGDPQSATVFIMDNEPKVTIEKTVDASEPDVEGEFTVRRTGSLGNPMTVTYVVHPASTAVDPSDGVPANPADYQALSGTVTIQANDATATITVVPKDDPFAEKPEDEILILSLESGADYFAEFPGNTAEMTIQDDEPVITVEATVPVAREANPRVDGEFTLTRSGGDIGPPLTVSFTVGGGALEGTHYVLDSVGHTVTFQAGEPSVTVAVEPKDNTTPETMTVSLGVADALGYLAGDPFSAELEIVDDECLVTVDKEADAEEPGVEGSFRVTRQHGDIDAPLTVKFTVAGSALEGVDFLLEDAAGQSLSDHSLVIPSGEDSALMKVIPLNDNYLEVMESVGVQLVPLAEYSIGSPAIASVIIDDVEVDPEFRILAPDTIAGEWGDSVAFEIWRSPAGGRVEISFALVGSAQRDIDYSLGADFGATPYTVVMGEAEFSAPVQVLVLDDTVIEGTETVTFWLTASLGCGYVVEPPGSSLTTVSVDILDDDAPAIYVDASGSTTTEWGFSRTLWVMLCSQPTADVVIGVSSSDPTEAAVLPASLTFTPSDWNVFQAVVVTGVDDAVDDGSIAYTVFFDPALSADPGYSNLDAYDVPMSNTDDDVAGILVTPTSGLETTEAGGTATFEVVLRSEPTADVTIGLSSSDTSEGTANPTSITFTSADWDVPRTVTVTGVEDAVDDGDVSYWIYTGPATSGDPGYDGMNAAPVSVVNRDND